MNGRLRWWVIPGAFVVMARIVTLDNDAPRQLAAPAASAPAVLGPVVAREASGTRSAPFVLGRPDAFVLHLPQPWAGRRITLRAARAGASEAWFTATPRVRADGSLPLAGLQPGRYDVELACGDQLLRATALSAPGEHVLPPR